MYVMVWNYTTKLLFPYHERLREYTDTSDTVCWILIYRHLSIKELYLSLVKVADRTF